MQTWPKHLQSATLIVEWTSPLASVPQAVTAHSQVVLAYGLRSRLQEDLETAAMCEAQGQRTPWAHSAGRMLEVLDVADDTISSASTHTQVCFWPDSADRALQAAHKSRKPRLWRAQQQLVPCSI